MFCLSVLHVLIISPSLCYITDHDLVASIDIRVKNCEQSPAIAHEKFIAFMTPSRGGGGYKTIGSNLMQVLSR